MIAVWFAFHPPPMSITYTGTFPLMTYSGHQSFPLRNARWFVSPGGGGGGGLGGGGLGGGEARGGGDAEVEAIAHVPRVSATSAHAVAAARILYTAVRMPRANQRKKRCFYIYAFHKEKRNFCSLACRSFSSKRIYTQRRKIFSGPANAATEDVRSGADAGHRLCQCLHSASCAGCSSLTAKTLFFSCSVWGCWTD
jgi:hypothetical protein